MGTQVALWKEMRIGTARPPSTSGNDKSLFFNFKIMVIVFYSLLNNTHSIDCQRISVASFRGGGWIHVEG